MKDKFINIDKFCNGNNILFVVGGSGSGKSTISKNISKKYKCRYCEGDDLRDLIFNCNKINNNDKNDYNNYSIKNLEEMLKNNKDINFLGSNIDDTKRNNYIFILEFIKENIPDYYKMKYDIALGSPVEYKIDNKKIYEMFINWISNKKENIVFECIDVLFYLFNSDFNGLSIVIKNTSLIKSFYRQIKRTIILHGISNIFSFLCNQYNHFLWMYTYNKMLNRFNNMI